MVSESVYVTVAIACVVTLLVVAVIVIYCIKRQQDKEQWRQAQEERARQERHRRQIRGNVVRPPPYCPRRQSIPHIQYPNSVPFTPPPAYKEMASPTPPSTQVVGIGGPAYPPPTYDHMPAVGHSVPPTTTVYNHHNNHMESYTVVNVERSRPTNAASNQDAASSVRAGSTSENQTLRAAADGQTMSTTRRRPLDPSPTHQITIPSYGTSEIQTHQAPRAPYDTPSISTNQTLRTSTNQAPRMPHDPPSSTSTNQTTRASFARSEQRNLGAVDAHTSHFTASQSRHGVNIAAHVQPTQGVVDNNPVLGTSTENNAARSANSEAVVTLPRAQTHLNTRNIEDLSLI